MSFKPRGIVKWHPFAAVTDTGVIAEELHQLNSLTTKPHISQDMAEEMERVIAEAIETDVIISVDFFRDNRIYTVKGKIEKYDSTEKVLIIHPDKIFVNEMIAAFFE